jgi:hypothetical protein
MLHSMKISIFMANIEIQLRSGDGSLHFTKNPSEAIKLISENHEYWKVSYSDKNGNDFRWEKIIKGEDRNETELYNRVSTSFKESNRGMTFWVNTPMSVLVDIVKKNLDLDKGDHQKIFYEECARKWPLLTHQEFCNYLMKIN